MTAANGRKSIFITGAASGMGLETARLFHDKGWFVGGYDLNVAGLESLKAELGAQSCITRQLNVTDPVKYQEALDEFAAATGGRLDILHNNAGGALGQPFADQPISDMLAVVQVNVMGVLIGIRLGIALLRATPGSMCFTTCSSSATFGRGGIAVYSATKHAVRGLTEALAVEFHPYGVKVADVLPGMIDTPIIPRAAIDAAPKEGMFRVIHPIEVAKVVWEAYHSDKLHWYVPPEICQIQKSGSLNPERMRDLLIHGDMFATVPDDAEA